MLVAQRHRCDFCGAAGAFISLTSVECLFPWCSRFSWRLALDPFTLEGFMAEKYSYAIGCLRSTPQDDEASKRKFRWTLESLLGTKNRDEST